LTRRHQPTGGHAKARTGAPSALAAALTTAADVTARVDARNAGGFPSWAWRTLAVLALGTALAARRRIRPDRR
jgi:hypothetical protein